MDHDAEIGEINRDLALLHARYAGYARAATYLQAILVIISLIAFVLFLKLFPVDALYGAFFVVMAAIVAGAALWFIGSLDLRWIDFVSQSPHGFYDPYFFRPDMPPTRRARSEAELIEWQIADRKRRLRALAKSAPA